MQFTLELAHQLYDSTEQFPVDFDEAWQWLEYSRKDSAKRFFEKAGFVDGIDFCSFHITVEREIGASIKEVFKLTCECLKQWGMMSGTQKGKEIRMYFLECEKIAKSVILSQPQLPQTYLEALKALVASEEAKEFLKAELDVLQDEVNQLTENNLQLSETVDELFNYSSIIRIAKFNNCSEKEFNWKKLKAASKVKNLEVKKVPCPRFKTKNLYSHDAWRYVYPDFLLPETTTLVLKSN